MRALFWIATALLAWTQALYAPALALLRRLRGSPAPAPAGPLGDPPPSVSLIVAAYREESVIAAKVANALALDWPRDQLEVIVAVDGGAGAGAAAQERDTSVRRRAGPTPPPSVPGPRGPTRCSSCRAAARCGRRTRAFAPRAASCSPSRT